MRRCVCIVTSTHSDAARTTEVLEEWALLEEGKQFGSQFVGNDVKHKWKPAY